MVNELTIFENKIRKKEHNLFPIQAKHRQELKELFIETKRQIVIKINSIRSEKVIELKKNHYKSLMVVRKEKQKECNKLNKEMQIVIDKIKVVMKTKDSDINCNINSYDLNKRVIQENNEYFYVSDRFEPDFYGKHTEKLDNFFDKIKEELSKLHKAFDESILFGDLDTSREIYFTMKNSNKYIDMAQKVKL